MLDIKEPVDVVCFFKKNRIMPFLFFWQNRKVKISQINLVHTSKLEGKLFYHFSILSGNNFYRLSFDSVDMKWILDQVEEGD